ncbi:MAG: AlkZ family DNA glycosylase [Caldilineales bacterium]|nr:AlkZ family DNA glycosylase [Caldilineales bacterium]
MRLLDIAPKRLAQQHIAGTTLTTPREIVGWMGAMQAQDFAMAKWAIGVRLPHATELEINAALNKGDILRTHVLRPTWHFVAADDIHWMLELTAPHIKAGLRSRHKQLGLSGDVVAKSARVIEAALKDAQSLTREALIAQLNQAQIATDENRASHLFMLAELDGIICSGPMKNGKQTYALLAERVPQATPLPRDEALAKLARTYFRSHGPATVQDFIWWSGLSAGDARSALELVQAELDSETIESHTYWFADSLSLRGREIESTHLLPAYDEFVISYRDRSAALPHENHKRAVSSNGVFWPTIAIDAQVEGVWKRTIRTKKVEIELDFFHPPRSGVEDLIEQSALRYGRFVQKEVEVKYRH